MSKLCEGRSVLVVEDEPLVAMLVEDLLGDLGCEDISVAPTVADALARIAEASPAFAILDVSLGGEPVFPVADALASRGTPFIFTTGYGGGQLDDWNDRPVLAKPFTPEAFDNAIRALLR